MLDWYKEDFGGEEGVIAFLVKYLPDEDRRHIEAADSPRLAFEEYDWTLNDTAVFGEHH